MAWTQLRTGGPVFYLIAPLAWLDRLDIPIQPIDTPAQARTVFADGLPVVGIPAHTGLQPTPGTPNPAFAPGIIASIEQAVADTRAGRASAVVTNPIAKHVLYDAGFSHPGHTEFLGALTADMPMAGPRGPVMMLANDRLRVALATVHIPLSDVPRAITRAGVESVIGVTHHAMVHDFGVSAPRIALCGVNPHAGENGALGREESDILNPLAAGLREKGYAVTNAQSADTLFAEHIRPSYDAAIAMYHDQGLVPVKTLDFHSTVNVTLGLPIVRTSPDHGPGFSLVGTNTARADSMVAALTMADTLARQRARSSAEHQPADQPGGEDGQHGAQQQTHQKTHQNWAGSPNSAS